MSETLMSERERKLQLLDSFRFSICEVNILYALLNELPKGGTIYKISKATSIPRVSGSLYHHLKRMLRRGLIKRSGEKGRHVYEALPIENREVRKIFEEHDDPMKIYLALDNEWLKLKVY